MKSLAGEGRFPYAKGQGQKEGNQLPWVQIAVLQINQVSKTRFPIQTKKPSGYPSLPPWLLAQGAPPTQPPSIAPGHSRVNWPDLLHPWSPRPPTGPSKKAYDRQVATNNQPTVQRVGHSIGAPGETSKDSLLEGAHPRAQFLLSVTNADRRTGPTNTSQERPWGRYDGQTGGERKDS